jgi:hypothetical protein
VAIGAVLTAHVLLSWMVEQGVLRLAGASMAAAYVVLYSLFGLSTWWIQVRARALFGRTSTWSNPGTSVQGRAGASTLGAVFLAHIVIMIGFAIAAKRTGEGQLMELLPITLFALQGIAWIVVFVMRGQRWHGALAWAWFAAAIGAAFFYAAEAFALFVAAVALLLMVLPGVAMMRSARRGA